MPTLRLVVALGRESGQGAGKESSGVDRVDDLVDVAPGQGFKRIEEYALPLEDEHMHQLYNIGTSLSKILIVNRERRPNRITMIIVKKVVGF